MKKFCVLCVLILAVGACSSKKKEETADATAEATTAAAATPAPEAAKTDAKKDSIGEGSKTSCTLDKDTRVVEVKKTETNGCELFYSKFGEAKSVASSGFGLQYCEEVKDRIESNLIKAGFSCQ